MGNTIITVDDSRSVRQMVSFTLREAGYDVIEAEDGRAALSTLKINKVELIITDLHMPDMNGIELISRLRKMPEYRFVPILMLTTEAQVGKKQEGKAAGATGWIVKPFHQKQLLDVVKKVLM